jgi:uncharacterized protein (DUF427 family)
MWTFRGQKRPAFATPPEKGQESVWDYPRPPAIKRVDKLVVVRLGDRLIASSKRTVKIMETASPPGYYIPMEDVNMDLIEMTEEASLCEWKGLATYWRLKQAETDMPVGWSYANPSSAFSLLKNHISFYPGRVECFLNDERVIPQPGMFYGGWITSEVVGPFKGEPGTGGW